ncbi:hypothetical protein D9M71_835040 [compost metagenome]
MGVRDRDECVVERRSWMTLDRCEQQWVLHGFGPSQYAPAITGVVGVELCNQNNEFLYTGNVGEFS